MTTLTRWILEDELERACIRRMDATVGMPTVWCPRHSQGSESDRQKYEIIGHGAGLHWPDLDEYVSVRSILLGRRSAEHTSESEVGDH